MNHKKKYGTIEILWTIVPHSSAKTLRSETRVKYRRIKRPTFGETPKDD